ncbi:hypothetical protein [Ensifer canadensis]
MTDFSQSDWRENDVDNTGIAPNGLQGGDAPSKVAPTVRAIRGALKRNYVRQNAIYTTSGGTNVYNLTYEVSPAAYVKGEVYRFYAHANNTGAAVININGLGNKAIVSQHGSALTANQIAVLRVIEAVYDGAQFVLIGNEIQDPKFSGTMALTGSFNVNSGGSTLVIQRNNANSVDIEAFLTANSATKHSLDLNKYGGAVTIGGFTAWHAGNDGAGSGSDMDLLDGQHGAFYQNASNINAGTLADARLPTTMAGKTFSSAITGTTAVFTGNEIEIQGTTPRLKLTDTQSGQADITLYADGGTFYVLADRDSSGAWETPHPLALASSTNTAQIFGFDVWTTANFDPNTKLNTSGNQTMSGTLTATDIITSNDLRVDGDSISIRGATNRHLWFQTSAGVNRGLLYHDNGASSLNLNLYNTSGSLVRSASFRESDGRFYVNGFFESTGNLKIGSATYQDDGNVYMPWAGDWLSNVLNVKIDGNGRSYPRRVGGSDINFNWSGQGGQPSWLWGGNDGTNMYVYNPSNFNVNWATGASNADTVDGLHGSAFAQLYYGTNQTETNFPVGHIIGCYVNSSYVNMNQTIAPRIGTANDYYIGGAGALLTGVWRARGVAGEGRNLAQRVS